MPRGEQPPQELVDVFDTEVNSGDIWNASDSFLFAHETRSAVTTTTWTASVSTPNSHVDEWGKACLMVRGGTAANARYFAVCRASDNHKLRIQYRSGLLANQGLAVSSHGSGKVKLLFTNVERGSTLYRAATFPNKPPIGGGVTSWRVFDGFFWPPRLSDNSCSRVTSVPHAAGVLLSRMNARPDGCADA
jgi:hypothetical protein